ncbi:MAG TPA: DUF58 domain-containing protein [Candidatus Ventrisoma faecale]|nr:DUF58 domain-containing protein [Candidatus Ventrisoma faecale]
METKQSRNSLLVSIPGLFCLLALALAANYFRLFLVSAFLIVVFLLALSSYVWSRGICRKLEAEVMMPVTACHAGDRVTVRIRVKNRSIFPMVWLDVILPVGERELVRIDENRACDQFEIQGGLEPVYGIRQRFVWLLWQQEITWEQEVTAVRRGIWSLPGVGLQAGDGFGLSATEDWKAFEVPVRLVIAPRLEQRDVSPFLKVSQEAIAGNRGQMEDITILKSSRPYQPGDPVKRINWRMLARSGQVLVNQYEQVMPGCTAFVLDLDTFHYIRKQKDDCGTVTEEAVFEEDSLERMLSRVASCMWELSGRGIQTALILPAYGKAEAFFCIPGRDDEREQTLKEAMEGLAALSYRGETVKFPYEDFWHFAHRVGNFCICTRTDEGTSLEELAEELGRGRVRFMTLEGKTGGGGDYEWIA